ncbi:protein fem-1 homolog B-like [Limulus polyphemus]|uniref:Protein fem-1 homolog B n=1 Tax=Limulus polyphemus TaxID=6850 RepID=A0ABM1BTW8_LIMPO|nr:protein fem-1 homolog B-like [Limulus polyphemus]
MNEARESLRLRVYYASRDGMAITLYALLAEEPVETWPLYLDYLVEEEGQKCTPLIIAAKNGHDKVVKMLLSKFNPDIEKEGTVQFDGYVIEGATPLWCAAGAGFLNVVKTLVKHGANVNHPTRTNSTPLRAACFDGRLDIVRFLVENSADIHIANKYNNTCLMIAAYKGHLDVVSYLLKKGADPDAHAHCGATSLHFAAEHGHLDVVKELLKGGANVKKNVVGMIPVMAAAERTKDEVVEYFITQPWCTKMEQIDALELLGASYANDKDNYNLEKAYNYLERAMKVRYEDPDNIISKPITTPIPAYDNRVESHDCTTLRALQHDPNALHMESLVIRERILGSQNPEVPHPVIFRGAVFADSARFDRCIQLWQHALRLRHQSHVTGVRKDLLRFAQVFSQMLHIGVEISIEQVEEVLDIAVRELERNVENLKSCEKNMQAQYLEELDDNIHTVLYLLVITTKLLKKCTKEEEYRISQIVYRLNQTSVTTQNGSTLLHLTVNSETHVDEFHTKNVCKFPCAATSKLLIQCGADVNAMDKERNTPLHIIVGYQNPITDFLTFHSIITALIEACAHMDAMNNSGETPFDAATTGVAEVILRTQAKLSLKCMAAKAVKKFNLNYEQHVPHTLLSFIEMHGVPCKPKLGVD